MVHLGMFIMCISHCICNDQPKIGAQCHQISELEGWLSISVTCPLVLYAAVHQMHLMNGVALYWPDLMHDRCVCIQAIWAGFRHTF